MKKYFINILLLCSSLIHAQTGNYMFAGFETVNFKSIDLATPTGKTWTTNRSATPGYFSAFYPSATFTNAADGANINGYVKKYGNETFTFPVGTGTDLRTLTISAPTASSDAYATAWILGDPSGNLDPTGPSGGNHPITSTLYPVVSVSNIGQWDWQVGNNMGATGSGVGLTITVSIPDMTTFANPSKLRLVGWNGTQWIDLSGGYTASGNTENSTLSGTMVAGISAIGIGSTYYVLPLTLESFTASTKNCDVALHWKTNNEINTYQFIIQQSNDGTHFTDAVIVYAKNNGANTSTYEAIIAQPVGPHYYRLQIIDKDGAFTFSSTINAASSCLEKESLSIYPNPTNGSNTLIVQLQTAYTGKAKIIVTNMIGQQIIEKNVQVNAGANNLSVDVKPICSGSYLLTILKNTGERITTTQKIIIK